MFTIKYDNEDNSITIIRDVLELLKKYFKLNYLVLIFCKCFILEYLLLFK